MPQTTSPTFDSAGFAAFNESRPQPEWLAEMRREAWEHAESMQWPERRHEEWIRTDIRTFQLSKFAPPSVEPTSAEVPADLQAIHQLKGGVELAASIETFDSRVIDEQVPQELTDQGVVFGSLERLCETEPDLIRKFLFTAFDSDYDKFAALHAAFWSGGQFLYVPRGVTIEKPIHIGSIMSDGGIDTTHTLIVLEEGAEATVLHEYNGVADNASGLHLGAVEIIQKPGSHLRYVNLQEWGHKTYHFAQQKAVVGRDSSLQWTLAAMGSLLTKANQSVDLIGPGANSQVNGVMFTEGRQHIA